MPSSALVVGAHPWVYAAQQPGYDIYPILDTIFEDLAAAGLDGIELMHTALYPDDAVERLAALSRRWLLPVIGSSFGGAMWDEAQHEAIFAAAERVVTRLAQVGGYTLGVSVGGTPEPKTPAQLDAQVALLQRISAVCEAHGVTLNLHNHTYEVVNNLHDLGGTLSRWPAARLGPDLNWLVRGGVDPVAFIRTYGRQMVFAHLRDQGADGRWVEAMGEGTMDYGAIGQALREVDYAGPLVIELAHEAGFERTRPLRESLRLSRDHVRRAMGW